MQFAAVASPADAPTATADIVLLPGRAAFLPASATLLVADLHLGKEATFRHKGIPVPDGSAAKDLARLALLVAATRARRLLILGDLFHSRSGCTAEVFASFTAARTGFSATEVLLVAGNHDRSIGRLPAGIGIDSVLRTHDEPPFHFVHEPGTPLPEPDRDEPFTIAGHLHPTLAIRSPSGDRVADRCFYAETGLLVLPAFGSFTGGHRVEPTPRRRLWIARDDGVVEVTRLAELAARAR
ncbi:MAG: ligase-associated damage response endonuclease PdeM [Planctomycetota bacterium]|jgi:DNA ligase-associated metallophosphoesterase